MALPSLVHTELLTVLAERQYCGQAGPRTCRLTGKAGSESCLTDEEDLGLPASLQNSPADYTRSLHSSRHHSSCSDNSLLSLDSEHGVTDSGAESLGSTQVGQLSHQAARHKMAVRPKRNHAVRAHRRLQQLTEVRPALLVTLSNTSHLQEQEPAQPPQETSLGSLKNKSKSLDKMFAEMSPSSSQLREMAREESNKSSSKQKLKGEQDGNFLSRLFGSKRLRLKTSASKRDGGVQVGRKAVGETEPQQQPSPAADPPPVERVTPPRHKHKPPPPPPPDTSPPPGVQVLPPLPTKRSDIIMKKKASLGGAEAQKETQGSHEKFQSSVQSWSLASEGRVRSLVSLNDRLRPAQSLSSESLNTINSLMEEPELLEHTSIVTAGRQDHDDLQTEAECYLTENKDVETCCNSSDGSHLTAEPGHQDESQRSNQTLHQFKAETSITLAEVKESTGDVESEAETPLDTQVNEIQPANTATIGGGGAGVFPVVIEGTSSGGEEAVESESVRAVNKLTTTIPTLAEIIANSSHNNASGTIPKSQAIGDNDGHNDNDKKGNNKLSKLSSVRHEESPPVQAVENMTRGESDETTKEDILVEVGEENETTSKCNQMNIKRKPEISPKPVPAPRTFFLRPTSKSSTVLESGGKNELLSVFARRCTSVSDVEDLKTNTSVGPPPAAPAVPDDKAGTREQDINVKERAKSFSGLQNYQLGPKPFRPLTVTTDKDGEKQKPKVAQKPTPAPRQFRSFSKLETANNPPALASLKTVKSASTLEPQRQEQIKIPTDFQEVRMDQSLPQSVDVKSSDKNLNHKDEYNLDDIQVRKIADKFQKNTPPPPKPVRKSTSPPNKKQEDENPENKNVMNIVTKINSMVVL